MKIYVQLLENNLNQQIPSIIVSTFNNNYIFNIPASYNRFIKTHNRRQAKKSLVFFSKQCIESVSGLETYLMDMFYAGNGAHCQLFVNPSFYSYLQFLDNKLGYRMFPFSYSTLPSMGPLKTRVGLKGLDALY